MLSATAAEPLLTLREAARLPWLPRRRAGKPMHHSALLRLLLKGRVKGAARVGGTWCVTERALRESFETAARDAIDGTAPVVAIHNSKTRTSNAARPTAGRPTFSPEEQAQLRRLKLA